MTILGPDGQPSDAPAVLPRAPVIWLNENEGIARHPVTGAQIGPFRVLTRNNCKVIPWEHRQKYNPEG